MDRRVGGMDWESPQFCDAFRRGDAWALESIYWAYVDGVEHVLRVGFMTRSGTSVIPGVRDQNRRADLIQEVFLRAFGESARQRFAVGLEYRPYLWSISRNVLVDHHRRTRRDKATQQPDLEYDLVLVQQPSEPEGFEPALVEVVERYVRDLGSPLREVQEMRFVKGKSQKEAAKELGISRQNVRTLEARLKEGLQCALQAAWRSQHSVRMALDGRTDFLPTAELRGK
jgi:RNA polymerase sigma factor (sigma-70 family)